MLRGTAVSKSVRVGRAALGHRVTGIDNGGREVRYGIDNLEWQQPFSARLLDEAALREMFARGGLKVLRWLDRPGWFLAGVAD